MHNYHSCQTFESRQLCNNFNWPDGSSQQSVQVKDQVRKVKAVVGYTNLAFISLGSTMDENNTVKHKLFPSNSKIIIQSLVGTQPLRLSTLETDRP